MTSRTGSAGAIRSCVPWIIRTGCCTCWSHSPAPDLKMTWRSVREYEGQVCCNASRATAGGTSGASRGATSIRRGRVEHIISQRGWASGVSSATSRVRREVPPTIAAPPLRFYKRTSTAVSLSQQTLENDTRRQAQAGSLSSDRQNALSQYRGQGVSAELRKGGL